MKKTGEKKMFGVKLLLGGFIVAAGAAALVGIRPTSYERPATTETTSTQLTAITKNELAKTLYESQKYPVQPADTPSKQSPVQAEVTASPPKAEPAPTPSPEAESPSPETESPPPARPLSGYQLAACLKNGRPTLANFGSGWCAECKRQAPVIDAAAAQFHGKANVVYVNVEEYADIARRHRVATIPCQVFFNAEGKEASRHLGFLPFENIAAEFARLGAGR